MAFFDDDYNEDDDFYGSQPGPTTERLTPDMYVDPYTNGSSTMNTADPYANSNVAMNTAGPYQNSDATISHENQVAYEPGEYRVPEEPDRTKKPKKPKKKKGPVFKIFMGLLVFCLIGFTAASIYVMIQIAKAPSIKGLDIAPDGFLTVIEDVDGNKMNSLYITESNRIQVTLDDTPQYLQDAFVAIEDSRFYTHNGIDLKGIIRAAVKGILNGGKFSEGASTITQQLLKNNVFEGWMEESSFSNRLSRKIQEQYLALQAEKQYSKQWILENYMNTINLGGGTRGVQVASQYYFGKDVSELTLGESAMIAGITKNPGGYDPVKHPDESIERMELVLDAMEDQGYITASEKAGALTEDILGHLITDHSQNTRIFSWFEDALLNSVVEDLMEQKGMSEDEAWNLIYSGGLTIHSTQNTTLQAICQEAANRPDFIIDNEQVSIVVTDVHTGAVAAIVGGRGEKDSSLVFNRATDSICQPGSTIKMIGEYAAAIDKYGVTLGTVYEDEPYTYTDGTEIHNANDIYFGKTTIRSAISTSCNVIALKLLQEVGVDRTQEYIRRFGITTLDENDACEALAIGGTYNGVTNLELTGAYNAIAADGQYIRPYYYTSITDHDGEVILQHSEEKTQVVNAATADLLTLGMEEVIRTGTGTPANIEGMELAAKSGTTNDYRAAWFVGYSSAYTCGVWGGHDDNSPLEDSTMIKYIWRTIMEQTQYLPNAASESLVDTASLTRVKICTTCGRLATENLCDQTAQGDMTAYEYYKPGTAPRGYCNCHVKLTLCSESNMRCSGYCPESCRYITILLKDSTPGTSDEGYGMEWVSDETCNVHTSYWDRITNKKKQTEKSQNTTDGAGGYNNSNNRDDSSDHGDDDEDDSSDDDSQKSFLDYIFGW